MDSDILGKVLGTVLYARIKCCSSINTSLWSVRCCIAPVISQTITNLELLSCLLLARLVTDFLKAFKGKVPATGLYCWSDFKAAL